MIMDQMIQFIKQLTGGLGGFSSLSSQTDPRKIAYMRDLQRELKNKDVLEIPFDKLSMVVFDLETSGFYPYKGDRILSIGAVKMQGDEILDEETFYSLVYSDSAPSEEVEQLTGITNEMLKDSETIHDVLKEFYQFIKSDVLVAHHANHEKQFMNHATWHALRKSFRHRIIDTTFLTKVIHPEAGLVTLDECCAYYNISNNQRHHALQDAIATAKLWSKCIREIQELGYQNLRDVYTHIATLR
ncbi:exonuclease domain-containing protein [Halobacillus ihumii]|uniref:exonuclease domain-containing protein n=1 Tax=Halobacillus ihumii TaxID=2686092 RepID=UPI001F0853D5|nr:exonuclease domain-containing protein [Halobacillus ihumii]